MTSFDLNGAWTLTYGPQTDPQAALLRGAPPPDWPVIPAAVPGNVELDLMAAGVLPDLSVGNHIYLLRDYEGHEWWYQREIEAPELKPGQRAELVFEGLDCIGAVWLDGRLIGRSDNMLIAHRFDVTDLLRAAAGRQARRLTLTVRIGSAVLEGRGHQPEPVEAGFNISWESLDVRKAPHMYGWDIMPRLVSAGLWRGVHLDILEPTRLREVYFTTLAADPGARTATLLADWDFATDRTSVDGMKMRVAVARAPSPPVARVLNPRAESPRYERAESPRYGRAESPRYIVNEYAVLGTHGRARIALADVDLWWPRGSGPAALHDATVELLDADGSVLDAHACRIGLRTVELRRTEITTDEQPGEFVFVVNGEKVYAKGTNWVPLDALHARDPQHLPGAIDMAADLNCNMIRCWGGNVYEDHAFFDLCDEQGILVWQDFALACAIYPQTDAFAARIRAEAESVVAKLRNHPSLALWAGNNEIDEAYQWAGTGLDPNTDRLSRSVLPEVVRRLDPFRPYLPSSPYRSPELVRRGNDPMLQPEQHLWGPRDDFKGPYYTSSRAHFVSEIGYHGCPDRRTLEEFLEPGFVWPWQDNEQWLTHATRPHLGFTEWNYRIALMAKQTAVLFERVPETMDDFILASQITQAEAKKFFIERWRQGKWRRTGMLWWNLRDGWPIISDAIVDYRGRKKLAYAFIRRIQADVCVMLSEPRGGRHSLVVVNDTRHPASGRAAVRDADTGRLLFEGDYAVGPNTVAAVGDLEPAGQPALWLIDYTAGGQELHNHYLAGPRPFDLGAYRGWLEKMGIQWP